MRVCVCYKDTCYSQSIEKNKTHFLPFKMFFVQHILPLHIVHITQKVIQLLLSSQFLLIQGLQTSLHAQSERPPIQFTCVQAGRGILESRYSQYNLLTSRNTDTHNQPSQTNSQTPLKLFLGWESNNLHFCLPRNK